MNIARGVLLAKLNEASIGLSAKEVLEQSSCFVFQGDWLTTFNDNIMVRVKSPLDFNAIVSASEMIGILSKMPDETVDITRVGGEVAIKGKRRDAGIACADDVQLPIDAVPEPEAFSRLEEGAMAAMQQAARTCGSDDTQYLTTCVHVTPDMIEGCDNFRFIRIEGKTGFRSEVLIPAASVAELEGIEIAKVSIGEGWVHFKTTGGARVSVRCSHESYHKDLDALLKMTEPEKIALPPNLAEIVERAEVFHTGERDARIGISIESGQLTIESKKDEGWYRERKKLPYQGRAFAFEINPKFLVEILKRTRDVIVDERKMKIATGKISFIVSLTAKRETPAAPKPGKAVKPPKPTEGYVDNEDFDEDDIPF